MNPYKFNDDLYQAANEKPESMTILKGLAVIVLFFTVIVLFHFV